MSIENKATPEKLPKPTYWPFFMALGIMFLFWGILATWVISAIGFIVFFIALGGWIADLYKEQLEQKDHEL